MEHSPRLSLPYLQPQQAQKHVTVNEGLRRLDAIVQLAVLSASVTAQPAEPDDGDRYIVPPAATGAAWETMTTGAIAYYVDGAWSQIAPREGWLSWIEDEEVLAVFTGGDWEEVSAGGGGGVPDPLEVGQLGVNTAPDATNRLAVKSDAALFHHDDVTPGSGDIRVIVNKAGAGDTASFLFQNDDDGRAEIGLAGNDDFSFKVSDDGEAWTEALVIAAGTGFVGVGTGGAAPAAPFHVGPAVPSPFGSGNARLLIADEGATNLVYAVASSASALAGCTFLGQRARGSFASPAVPLEGDRSLAFLCSVYDGAALRTTARIQMIVDGTVTEGAAPQRIEFQTGDGSGAAERMRITSDGNIGIGTASPTALLHVNGSLSKTSGSFDIAHPDPAKRDTHRLRHCFVESPTRGDNLYRFRVEAAEDSELIEVPLPAYWRHLNENPQAFVSPDGHFGRGYAWVDAALMRLFVHCERPGAYNVLLIGTRKDDDARQWFDKNGVEYQQEAGTSDEVVG